jgi:hypothetical protein
MARRGSSAWWIEHYGKPCIKVDHVAVEWYPGVVGICHRGTEKIWQALGAIFLAYGYTVPTSYTGDYKCRSITGGSKWSGHAWPVAKDVNAKTNPYINHRPLIRTIKWGIETDMPAAMIREIESITASGHQALGWGGRWRTVKDAMHFQLLVTLIEIAGGVESPRGFYQGPVHGGDEIMLKRGDSGNAVRKHQEALNGWGANPAVKVDSDFGPATEAGVKQYQGAADLPQTGTVDGITSAMLMTYLTGGGESHTHEATVKVEASA